MASAAPLNLKAAENALRAQVRLLVRGGQKGPEFNTTFTAYKKAWANAPNNVKKANKSPSFLSKFFSRAMSNKTNGALSFAQKLRRKGGVRGAIGQVAKVPEFVGRGIGKGVTSAGTRYTELRGKVGNPTNKNYQSTINRYKKLSKQKFDNKASNLAIARALSANASKKNYISWPLLYSGNKTKYTAYANNVVNYARRKAVNNGIMAGNYRLQLNPTTNSALINNLVNKTPANRIDILRRNVANYNTLAKLLGNNVNKFIAANPKFANLARAAGTTAGAAKVAANLANAEAEAAMEKKKQSRIALLDRMYKFSQGTTYDSFTKFPDIKRKALAISRDATVTNMKTLPANTNTIIGENATAVYNLARQLSKIPKTGNRITPKTKEEAKLILNAANLTTVVNPSNKSAIMAKLTSAGINATKYNFKNIEPWVLPLQQQRAAINILRGNSSNRLIRDINTGITAITNATTLANAKTKKLSVNRLINNLRKINTNEATTKAASATAALKAQESKALFNSEYRQFTKTKAFAKLGSLKAFHNRMQGYSEQFTPTTNQQSGLDEVAEALQEARLTAYIQDVWRLTSGRKSVSDANVNAIRTRIFGTNPITNDNKAKIKNMIPVNPPVNSSSIIGWKRGVAGFGSGANRNYVERRKLLNTAIGINRL